MDLKIHLKENASIIRILLVGRLEGDRIKKYSSNMSHYIFEIVFSFQSLFLN